MTDPSAPPWPAFSNSTLEKSAFVKDLVRAIEAYHHQARNLFLFGKVQLRGKTCCYDLAHYAALKQLRATPAFTWLAPSALQYVVPRNAAGTGPLIAPAAIPAAIAADDVDVYTINDTAIFDIDRKSAHLAWRASRTNRRAMPTTRCAITLRANLYAYSWPNRA